MMAIEKVRYIAKNILRNITIEPILFLYAFGLGFNYVISQVKDTIAWLLLSFFTKKYPLGIIDCTRKHGTLGGPNILKIFPNILKK